MKRLFALILTAVFMASCLGGTGFAAAESAAETEIRVGVAWRADTDSEFYTNICKKGGFS